MKNVLILLFLVLLSSCSNQVPQVIEKEIDLSKCSMYFDGCNNCMVSEEGNLIACTKMACSPESMKDPYCIEKEEPRICTREYIPVCAEVEVQCIRAPCPPIKQTFGNSCEAGDNKILYEGECTNDKDIKKEINENNNNQILLTSVSNIKVPSNYSCEYNYFSGETSLSKFESKIVVENEQVLIQEGIHNKMYTSSKNANNNSINYSYSIIDGYENENCIYEIKNKLNSKMGCSERNLKDLKKYSRWLSLENAKSDIFESIYNDNFTSVKFDETKNCFDYDNYDKFGNYGKSKICFANDKLINYTYNLVDISYTSTKNINCEYMNYENI